MTAFFGGGVPQGTHTPSTDKLRSIIVLSDGETWDFSDNCEIFQVPATWDSAEVDEFLYQYRHKDKGNLE